MDKEIQKVLDDYSESYVSNRLTNTFYNRLTPEERDELVEKFMFFLKPIIDESNKDVFTDIKKALLIYEVISNCVTYNYADKIPGKDDMRDTYVAGLATGKAICMGIAEIYTLLCSKAGVKVDTVVGYGGDPKNKGGAHAWNIVWLKDGEKLVPYHVDLTWDLLPYISDSGNFRYFLKSDDYMRAHNHEWKSKRYAHCPGDRKDIPKIKPEAINYLCDRFLTARNSLKIIKI